MAVTSKLCRWDSSRKSAQPDILKYLLNFKQPKKKDLPQQITKNIQAGNYCIKNFELSIVTSSKEKILYLKKIAPNTASVTSKSLADSAENN